MRRYGMSDDFAALHALLTRCFAYMQGRIDPPSSLNRLTVDGLREMAENREVWVMEDQARPIACMILTPRPDTLYLGKLAVDSNQRGKGLARALVEHALHRAERLGLESVTLETRIELVENHATFGALGFRRIAETAHPGYDRPTSITMTRSLGGTGRGAGRGDTKVTRRP
ncbi:GNAT family N-acetyltransferase [Roseovarius sp.]|uniref:GNAT family N-acetyltransferase n=1 Tax=Roseovarius sp. TaxID=1486281 RepID=UPI0025DA1D95|nr:GNAT family N-acetyltransferase [Roseovarius sp.]